jgi:RHS repeat-associated protein
MRIRLAFFLIFALGIVGSSVALPPPPGSDPSVDPTGDAGVLKGNVVTGGGYDAHSGNATRSVTDLHVPGAVGVYGLDFTRHFNSTAAGRYFAPTSFGRGGWSHSWEWGATWNDEPEDLVCYDGESPPEDLQYEGSCFKTHKITIIFPDGRTQEFYFQRNNYDNPNTDLYAPPYPGEWDGHAKVTDHLRVMDADGSQFWLYLADGGSVHFVGGYGPGSNYHADQVLDPHGLVTQLVYENGALTHVIEPAGRSIDISYKYVEGWPGLLIDNVQSGSGEGLQQVTYGYDFAPSNTGLALYSVTYVGDENPNALGTDIQAIYDYYGFVSPEPGRDGYRSGPMLVYANDPRFAGAMTRIGYTFWGSPGGPGYCNPIQAPPPGDNKLNWVMPTPYALFREKSGETDVLVSQIEIPCGALVGQLPPGQRRETRGAGGQRMFYFGTSAGLEPAALANDAGQVPAYDGSYSNWGYRLHKVTDFSSNPASNTPFDYQHYFFDYPRRIFDGRRILTEVVMQSIPGSPVQQPDGSGRVAEVRHLSSDGTTRFYNWTNTPRDSARIPNDYKHWLSSQTDERNKTTYYTRDTLLRVTRIDYADGSFETFENYDAFNQFQTHRLPSGAIEYFEYDGRGLLQREWNSVDGEIAAKIYSYKASDDRVWRVQDGRARANGKDYSAQMEYNKRGQVIAIHYPSTPGGSADPTVFYGYDAYGNRTKVTNELGQTTKYKYDAYRRCIGREEPIHASKWNGIGIEGCRKWNWYYDRWDDATQTLLDASTHTSSQWRVQVEPAYNAAGDRRLSAKKYDYNDRVIEEASGLFEDANGGWNAGPDTEVHQFEYDANGNKQLFRDPLTRVTTYTYDHRNRLKQTIEPKRADQSVNPTTTNEYDETGNKKKVTFPNNTTQQWLDYDAFGQAQQFIDERGNTTDLTYWWGPMKKLRTVTTYRTRDPGSGGGIEPQPTTFMNDGMGRLLQTLFPDQSYENSSYQFGQLQTWRTRKGEIKYIHYDARGREDSHAWGDQSGGCNPGADTAATPCISRSWDDANRLASITNRWSSIDYGYDASGQVMLEGNEIAGSGGRTQTNYYRYPSGEVAHLHYPGGAYVRRDYTARGQLAATGWDDENDSWWMKLAAYTYLPDGRVDQIDHGNLIGYGNVTTTTFGYDDRGITSSVQHKRASGDILASRSYARDNRDRVTAFRKGVNPGVNPMEDGRGDRFAYDDQGQVTDGWYNALDPAGNTTGWMRKDHFDYDAMGNRQGSSNNVASRNAGFTAINFSRRDNGLNQYLNWTPSIVYYDDNFGAPYLYPGNGVMMADGFVTASYNALNQPIAIWSPSYQGTSDVAYFGYDPLGRCVKRWVGESGDIYSNPATYFHYEGWNLLQEGSNAWGPARVYVHGNRVDEIVWSYNTFTGDQAYHHYDTRGHCIMLTDSLANILEQYEYDAFGQPYFYDAIGTATIVNGQPGSPFGNRFLFTGREWLSDLHLYDYRNRMYQPELGRFLQPDPQEFAAGDYNLYRYCGNDPVNRRDPMGLISWESGAGLTSWGNGDWMADGGFNSDLVAAYQKIRDAVKAFIGGTKQADERSENGRLRVQSAKVDMTHRTLEYHNADDDRGGYTPNPLETKGGVRATSVQESPDNLSLTYHLQIQTRLNLSRGAGTRLWAKLREPDHWNDFHDANARFQGAAGTLIGQRFNTEDAATRGLMSAVNPVVQQVYDESYRNWDANGNHRPRDLKTLQRLRPDE